MKNLYLFSLFSLLVCIDSFAQSPQNANWVFGKNWLNFNPGPTSIPFLINGATPTTITPWNSFEGCASVSDSNGVLLFISDGVNVYQNTVNGFQLITNQLLGNYSSTQNVIIVPKPNNPMRYYVFTIDGWTGESSGLYYTEFDFSAGIGQVVPGTLNTPLKDNNGVPIDWSYANKSEGLTSVLNTDSNCSDYWVLAHVSVSEDFVVSQGAILSYRVTDQGVVNSLPSQEYDFNRVCGAIKISPDMNRIAVTGVGVFLGGFNPDTGEVSGLLSNVPLIGSTTMFPYGLEFSQNSQVLYYSSQSGNTNSRLTRVNLSDFSNTIINRTSGPQFGGIQLANDGRIYITDFDGSIEVGMLNVINSPNSITGAINLNTFALLTNHYQMGLPQRVWSQSEFCCQPTLITSSAINIMIQQERSDWIKTTDLIAFGNGMQGDGIVYHAGNFVELNPGFEAVYSSQFTAYIEVCSGDFVYKNGENIVKEEINQIDLIKSKITIYPNPTSNLINISYANSKFNQIKITSIEGRVVYNQKTELTNSYQLDISNFKNGIYTLSVVTIDGTIFTEKLIKN